MAKAITHLGSVKPSDKSDGKRYYRSVPLVNGWRTDSNLALATFINLKQIIKNISLKFRKILPYK